MSLKVYAVWLNKDDWCGECGDSPPIVVEIFSTEASANNLVENYKDFMVEEYGYWCFFGEYVGNTKSPKPDLELSADVWEVMP